MVMISADAGGVAADLHRIDPCLKVRFAENARPPFWAVYHESPDGRDTYLVLTAKAYQNHSGVWEGLDQRIVKRIEEIDPRGRSGYDFAKEVEHASATRREKASKRFAEQTGEYGELAAYVVRRELGERYKGRAFVPKDVT